jgi:acyl-CoA reductase-like NAD-dependent aldehyde dehydrogenase
VESGTVNTSSEAANGTSAVAPSQLEVHNPATGGLIATIPIDSPAAVAATVARVRANQADWEAMGIEGRYHWLGKLRDWLLDNSDRCWTRCSWKPARSAPTPPTSRPTSPT